MHLLAQVHHTLAVFGMQMLHPELQGLQALVQLRGNAAEVTQPIVDVHDTFAEVHLVEREAGELGPRRQTSLAL